MSNIPLYLPVGSLVSKNNQPACFRLVKTIVHVFKINDGHVWCYAPRAYRADGGWLHGNAAVPCCKPPSGDFHNDRSPRAHLSLRDARDIGLCHKSRLIILGDTRWVVA